MLKNYLSESDLENIKNHKYNYTGYSWLDKKFEPFWDYLTLNVPYVISFYIIRSLLLICSP